MCGGEPWCDGQEMVGPKGVLKSKEKSKLFILVTNMELLNVAGKASRNGELGVWIGRGF